MILDGWLGVVIMTVLGVGFAATMIGLSLLLGPKNPTPEKLAPYECGMPAVGNARERHSVKFYLVAMIFLLFDIEVAFLYPWAMALRDLGWAGYLQIVTFFLILLVGYVYVWRKGVLDWGPVARSVPARSRPAPVKKRLGSGTGSGGVSGTAAAMAQADHTHGLDHELPDSHQHGREGRASGRGSRRSGRRSSASPAAPSR